ncbi:hypothetical protein SEPCBS119000_005972 [Sporothrix epigloea]|uniref:J domain-containing protein n=1 Tax=Sporothrix epigloea TaxID=1892477 RepID=A0ABP0E3W3_9PEZI
MANDAPPPNYYAILSIPETATAQQVRDAYKRAALKNHPDRVPVDSPERKERTRKFQLVNDAYYTLSDAERRKEYDAQRRLFGRRGYSFPSHDDGYDDTDSDFPESEAGGGMDSGAAGAASWAWNFFNSASKKTNTEEARQQTEDAQFSDVFEEMMREEGMAEPGSSQPTGKFWGYLGGLSGGALGFIVANVPGMVAGAVAGNRLGAIRDAKGKSVYAVFQELPADDRARMLSQLAVRVFSQAVGV